MKHVSLSIVLNGFLAYLLILFIQHVNGLVQELQLSFFISGTMIFLGIILFGEIFRRITPLNTYAYTHPVKIAGIASSLAVLFIYLI